MHPLTPVRSGHAVAQCVLLGAVRARGICARVQARWSLLGVPTSGELERYECPAHFVRGIHSP
jgi:hypothetical protein